MRGREWEGVLALAQAFGDQRPNGGAKFTQRNITRHDTHSRTVTSTLSRPAAADCAVLESGLVARLLRGPARHTLTIPMRRRLGRSCAETRHHAGYRTTGGIRGKTAIGAQVSRCRASGAKAGRR